MLRLYCSLKSDDFILIKYVCDLTHKEMKVCTTFVSKERIKNSQEEDITSADEVGSRSEYIHCLQILAEKVKVVENTSSSEQTLSFRES